MIRAFAEWEEQEAIMVSLPHKNSDWAQYLDEILNSYEEFIKAMCKFQKVIIIAPDDLEFKKRFSSLQNVEFYQIDTNDTWIRDYGAIDVQSGDKIISYDFKFNAWGGKFQSQKDNNVNKELFKNLKGELKEIDYILEGGSVEFNGDGVLLTTSECLLNDNRNSHLSKEEIEEKLKELFGLKRIIFLNNGFIKGDDTDSHIDTLARFVNKNTIAYASCDDENDEHFLALKQMENELKNSGFDLLPLPLPKPVYYENKRLGATYLNFIFINNAIIVPTYNDEKNDKFVIESLKNICKDKEVIGVDARVFIRQNGSLHCSSQNRFLGNR